MTLTSLPVVFQLTTVSQNDPGCYCGDQIYVKITGVNGGQLRDDSFPVNTHVSLPIPPPKGLRGVPSPTWFLELNTAIENASFQLAISGPCIPTTTIVVPGKQMQVWVDRNRLEKTNQIYLGGSCGVFGFAQLNEVPGQGTYWIYTITGGADHPQIHGGD